MAGRVPTSGCHGTGWAPLMLNRETPWRLLQSRRDVRRDVVVGGCKLCKEALFLWRLFDSTGEDITDVFVAHKNQNALDRCLFLEQIISGART